ncbi:hypothetical protein JY651_11675 [Pyxidicoccus parkwayensis]|uniref:Lipoprotein n=1 Tax=Pyxidicoccus parkwayensis TaxID=2813578 RepID=A0ABX7P4Z3_9BACT|nr:hypothetical protein [Pyxidicoccus parkwaysis]QSQ25544.1 hypothetical protein JY651_11675 [Pyxidicoccus parkwaysis]
MSRQRVLCPPSAWKLGLTCLWLALPLSAGCDASTPRPTAEEGAVPLEASRAEAVTDPPEEPDVDLPLIPVSELRGPRGEALAAPVLATVRTPEDVVVEFIQVDGESIGLAIGGPETQSAVMEQVVARMSVAASPAAFYLAVAPSGSTVPLALQTHSDRVVAAGNWKPAGGMPAARQQSLGSAPSLGSSCLGVRAFGEGTLHENHGSCDDNWQADIDEETTWMRDDVIAFMPYVHAVSGSVFWDIQKRNCKRNACDWYTILRKTVPQGHVYFYPYVNLNDDYVANSRVTSNANNGVHQHYVGLCHDWHGRTLLYMDWAGGCAINFKSTPLFCNKLSDEGPDPSRIATSTAYDGSGNIFTCGPH